MGNAGSSRIGQVAVVVAALLATYVGIKYAKEELQKEELQIESTRATPEKVKESEWVRVDSNGHVIPSGDPATMRKIGQ